MIMPLALLLLTVPLAATCAAQYPAERQLTHGPGGRVLTNTRVWSPDGKWLAFDCRGETDAAGVDGTRIQLLNVETGAETNVYTSKHGASCLVVTFHPHKDKVIFILGPENPTPDWKYGFAHRQGVIVDLQHKGRAVNLEARDIVPPFTPGALRGGSHVHIFSPDGECVSFTYNDHVLPMELPAGVTGQDIDQRNVGVSFSSKSGVHVPKSHPRNHDGAYFTVLATRTVTHAVPGSDEIEKAYEEGWIGNAGYHRPDGTVQKRALAFQGDVITAEGKKIPELFVVDLPSDVTKAPADGPLQGTDSRRPLPPLGTVQRRLTHTSSRKYPGLATAPRHWIRSSPDGTKIAFLMHDDDGIVQLFTISPNGGEPHQVTNDGFSITSTINWSPDGSHIAYAADSSIFTVEVSSGKSRRLTAKSVDPADGPTAECVDYSPDGTQIAYMRNLQDTGEPTRSHQIFVVHSN